MLTYNLCHTFFVHAVAIAAICFLISLSSCISFICRVQKSHNTKIEDLEKKKITNHELSTVAVLGNSAPVTIIHNVQLQNQDQQASNTNVNTNTEAYDSFESDDDNDNTDPTNVPEQGMYPDINTQNQELQGGYPEGTYTYYQGQENLNTGLREDYVDEGDDVKYDIVTESSHDELESDYVKQEFDVS